MDGSARSSPIAPLVLATMAAQSLLVVLGPTIVAVGTELDAPVGVVGQARSITAGVAVAASLAIGGRIGRVGVPRLLRAGAAAGVVGSAAVAAAPTTAVFLGAHGIVGLSFACLVTAGFAGAGAFPAQHRRRALGQVAGANGLAWILVNPVVGVLTGWASWRVAHIVPAAIALAALVTAGAAAGTGGGGPAPSLRGVWATAPARHWLAAETVAYAAWAALLTFVGAYFIDGLGVTAAGAGWLLASGAAAFVLASVRSASLTDAVPERTVVAVSALVMAALLAVQFATASVAVAVALFCLTGLAGGIRTPASSGLGLEQLPDHPGTMMAARTAATQVGYLLGAVVGGAVIAAKGYGALGVVLAAAMAWSALLVMRLAPPAASRGPAHIRRGD